MKTRRKMKLGTSDRIILGVGYTLLGLFVLAVFVPLVYVVLASFMDPNVLNNQGISFDFKDWTLDAYKRVLENDMIWRGFANSFFYSAAFTVISVFITLLAAYPMSKKDFVGRKFFNIIFVITMFFGGGMIPKLKNCIDAIEHGVNRVHILDGRIPHSLLLEIFTNKGIGTAILKDDGEKYYNEHE